ncbi:MAG: hypothetical protein ACREGF_02810 [Candidatus Saccharimonadales bacterium]
MPVKQKSAATAAQFPEFPPRKHLGFASQNQRKNGAFAPQF